MIRQSYCRVCTSMCGTLVEVDEAQGRVVAIRGDVEHPLTRGYTCSKGRDLPNLHHSAERLLHPQMGRGADARRVSWDAALDDLAARLRTVIDEHGPDAVGVFLGGGGYIDATAYAIAREMPQAIGTRSAYSDLSIDAIAKVLVSEMMVGVGGLMNRPDLGKCKLVIYAGTNPMVSHGHTTMLHVPTVRMREFNAGGEVWVLDPRRTETATRATRHLAPRPGGDYAVFAHLVREILREGADEAYVAAHTQGRAALTDAVERFTAPVAAGISGVSEADLAELVAAVRRAGRLSVEIGTGITMSPSGNVTQWLAWALMILTGSLDREGGSWVNPGFLTQMDKLDLPLAPEGGWNAAGPRSRPELRALVGELPCSALPDEIEAGHLKALINLGGNLVVSLPHTERTVAALNSLEVLATIEVVETDTTGISTHVLPSKDQLERADLSYAVDVSYPVVGMSYTPAMVEPAGEIRSFWWILAQLGKRLGLDFALGRDPDQATDADMIDLLVARGRVPIETRGEAQYVVAEERAIGWVHRYVDQIGGWRLAPAPLVEQLAGLQAAPPLTLVSRRQAHRVNSKAYNERDKPLVHLSRDDADEQGIADAERIVVRTPHGRLEAVTRIDPTLPKGVVQLPHGWGGEHNVNVLTSTTDVDSLTGMPRLSGLPVELIRTEPLRQTRLEAATEPS